MLTCKPDCPGRRIFSGYRAPDIDTHSREGCNIVRAPLILRGNGGAWELTVNYLSFVLSTSLLGLLALRRHRFDVVFVYGVSSILKALVGHSFRPFMNVPVVNWAQDLWSESLAMKRRFTQRRLLGGIVRWIYRRSDFVLVQSRACLKPNRRLADPVEVAYQPNPGELSPSTSSRPATSPEKDTPSTKPSLNTLQPQLTKPLTVHEAFNNVFVGNLDPVRALETVIEAARLTGSGLCIRWVSVGSGARGGVAAGTGARRQASTSRRQLLGAWDA